MDSPSVPSLSEREDSNKPVPKIFIESNWYEQEPNSRLPEVEKSTSFIQKIMTNAKSMLGTRCNSLHPSTCSGEEPTRETDNCIRYAEAQGKVFRGSDSSSTRNRLKYTSSDYCMIDDDSSKQDTTATETLPKEFSGSTGGTATLKDNTGSAYKSSGDATLSSTYTYDTSNKDTSSKDTPQKRAGNLNGPFEPSDFFEPLNTAVLSNNVVPPQIPKTSVGVQKVEKKSFSLLDGWIRPFKNEKSEVKKNDLNIPCRDESNGIRVPSLTALPIIRHVSKASCTDQPCNCLEINDDEEEEEDIPAIFPRPQYSSSRDLPCFTCGLKRKLVSSPSPSVGEEIWPTNSGKVKTIYCESERFASKVIVCGDESNVSNACGDDITKPSDNIELSTDSKPNRKDPCSLGRINIVLTGKTPYGTPVGTRSEPRRTQRSEQNIDTRSGSRGVDQDNQCAFVGSPILQSSNFRAVITPKKSVDLSCNINEDYDKFGDSISDVNTRERAFHSQIQGLKSRERQYDNIFNSLEGEIARCHHIGDTDDELERVAKELKNENKVLKSEVMEMKLELKHTLDKVQGPMRLKLEAEKSRCEQLQTELQKTSQNIATSNENYIREMTNLKMQLCMACANMTELENVNKRLKEEMNVMDGLCAKLEDDLMQQKLNEAEMIKRLTNRKNGDSPEPIMVYNCESNLHDIARKLSKTIKECIPCSACASGIPAELKGAARLIKDLTDMVESRKETRSFDSLPPSRTDMSCQSPPITEENSTQCMDLRNIGTVVSMCLVSNTKPKGPCCCAANRFQATKTLYAGSHKFVDKEASSQFNIKLLSCKSGPDQADSFFSARPSPSPSGDKPTPTPKIKSPLMQDGQTDPKMVDKQISSGHVHFNESKPNPVGRNDPMMVDKNVTYDLVEDCKSHGEGISKKEPCTQFPKKIVFEINTALIKTRFKDADKPDSKPDCSRPVVSKPEDGKIADSKPEDCKLSDSKPEIKDIDLEEVTSRPSTPIKVLERNPSYCKTNEGPWIDNRSGKLLPDDIINLGLPLCNKPCGLNNATVQYSGSICKKDCPKLCKPKPCISTCPGKVKVTELKLKTGEGGPVTLTPGAAGAIAESETFPFEVNTQVDLLNEPPPGLNVTTCITDSGSLEVITEGPAGVIETTLNYKDDGTIEVVTQIVESNKEASTATAYSSRTVGTSSPSRPKSPSCHALCSGLKTTCAANRFKEQKQRNKSAVCGPPCLKSKKSSSATKVCVCPCKKLEAKPSKSCSELCAKISQISAKASAIIQVIDPRNWSKNFSTSTTKIGVDRCQSCMCTRADRSSSTPGVAQISATTSEATKKNSISFGTGKISMQDVVICGKSGRPCTQQTNSIDVCQKSTGEENTKATCSSLTAPISTSCKCEDTYQSANELRSDGEVSCSSEICHRETCTDAPKKRNVGTHPQQALTQDQWCMCDSEGKLSKEAAINQTLEFSCQSSPLPSEQSCQCNESKETGVSTFGQSKESMTKDKLAVCGKPPCSLPCSVPCSPCSSASKLASVCDSVCSQHVGDSVHSKLEEFHSAQNVSKPCNPCTCGKEFNCTCNKKSVCSKCTCENNANCKCETCKKGRDKEVVCSVRPTESTERPKKKRPGKLTNLECLCPGPCNCVICAPNIIEDRKEQTGSAAPPDKDCQICCLKPQTSKPHPKDCDCPDCICAKDAACQKQYAVYNVLEAIKKPIECIASCAKDLDETFMGSLNLECASNKTRKTCIDDIFKKNLLTRPVTADGKPSRRHPLNCECIDCLCMPTVRQLALTREFPIVKDEKQIYQVTTNCQCPNTKKGSKIPVATRGGKPGGKGLSCNCTGPCTCSPCSDPEKSKKPGKKEEAKAPKRMTAEQLAELCDCGKCDCPICAKKSKGKKACCCTPDCICDSCKIDMMKKQIDKLKSEVNELKGISEPPDLGHPEGCDCGICNCPLPPGEDPRRDQPDDCDCLICDCPLAPGKGGDMTGCTCTECDCPKGPRFQKPKVKKPIDLSGCTCNPCKCPGGPLSAFPKCDCKVCECDPCSDPRKPKKVTCDCEPCECSPCGDPKRQAKKWRPKECECKDCQCSGLKDKECTCVTCLCGQHPPNCTCDKCICGDQHPPGCKCPTCTCGDKAVDHPPGCQCDKCKCPGPAKPCPAEEEEKRKLAEYLKRTTSTHAIDCKCAGCKCLASAAEGAMMCTCNPCKCVECIFDKQRVVQHPPTCKCIVCTCKNCDGGAGGAGGAGGGSGGPTCKCTDCKCKPCTHKGAGGGQQRGKDCKCGVCNCKPCDIGGGDKKKEVKEVKSAPALPKSRSCHCITCYCDSCNNPAKKGSGARPDIVIKGAGKKTVAAGPSSTSVKKAPTPSGDHPQECKCGTCLCKECSYGAKHGPGCKCKECICRDCGTDSPQLPPPSKSTTDCSCKPCACKECAKMPHPPGCKCPRCACKPCETKPKTKDATCHCATCKCKECAGGSDPPRFSTPKNKDCDCKQCKCVICAKSSGGSSSGFQVPSRIACQCKKCACEICSKGGGGAPKPPAVCPPPCPGSGGGGGSSAGFQIPKRISCQCKQCNCIICNKQGGDASGASSCGGLALRGGGAPMFPCNKDPPPFEIPSRMPCVCNPCNCIMCNKQGGKKEGAISARPSTTVAGVQCRCPKESSKDLPFSVPSKTLACDCPICSCPSCTSSMNRSKDEHDGPDCDCSLCRCTPCADPKISKVSAKVGDVRSTHSAKVGISMDKHTRSTSCICTPMRNAKVGESENRFGACDSIELNVMNLAAMDNATLMKNIEDNTRENSNCKNQIDEITSVLSNIKSACNDVEEKAMKTPLIKQASAFGQTMSGLKLALNNLQEKCKAKDLLIEAMTGELRNRTNSNTFLQVFDNCVSVDAPDYDKAADIVPKNYDEKKNKAMEGDKIVKRRRGSKTCKCGRQHKDKDYKNVDLTGFEVVDIRRITDDSIIIKWKPPKIGPITGYDIFINGVNKSKVMSGGRTSAMVHSIDLSATIQITIYAVTKCGRCEPPAIAIYEIRT